MYNKIKKYGLRGFRGLSPIRAPCSTSSPSTPARRATSCRPWPRSWPRSLACETAVRSCWFDPELAFDASRGQYNSAYPAGPTVVRKPHRRHAPAGCHRGRISLFPSSPTSSAKRSSMARRPSFPAYRLDNRLYGLPPDRNRHLERLLKEAIHELGHTYQLIHCRRHPCVMMSSTYVEDIDQKSDRFCGECLRGVKRGACLGAAGR